MTQNYKWYRLLEKDEYLRATWSTVLGNHVDDLSYCLSYREVAPDLFDRTSEALGCDKIYTVYVEWWNAHFGTKLHKLLAGVENAD